MALTILYAEDEKNDIFFLRHALEQTRSPHTLKAVPDGEQAIAYLSGDGEFADRDLHPLPALVLLDINIPKTNGLEVLEWIRRQSHLKSLPVLMLTSSTRPEDMEKARQLGADDYLSKPSDPADLLELVKSLHDCWLSQPTTSPRPGAGVASEEGRTHTEGVPSGLPKTARQAHPPEAKPVGSSHRRGAAT